MDHYKQSMYALDLSPDALAVARANVKNRN